MAYSAACAAVLLATGVRAVNLAGRSQDTPVTRVVNLLKEMSKDLTKDMEDDEASFGKLTCWCNTGRTEKGESIQTLSAHVEELKTFIEGSTAKSSELRMTIKELEESLAAGKEALAEATELRQKQLSDFQGMEADSVQAVENLKAAIVVLSKHHPEDKPGALVQSADLELPPALVQLKSFPWGESREDRDSRALDNFMRASDFDDDAAGAKIDAAAVMRPAASHRFLQQSGSATPEHPAEAGQAWSFQDTAVLQHALHSAAAFVQAKHKDEYVPSYNAQSSEIFGVLKQLKEEMETDLKDSQQREQERGVNFKQLSDAKAAEIKNAQVMSEQKEDELANMDNALAEAKDDIVKETKVLEEDTKFLANLKVMCSKGAADFDERKQARLEELKAVGETVQILQQDEARDAMSGAFSFVQVSARRQGSRRARAAALLRRSGFRSGSLDMSLLATSVEVDAFVKVNEAISEMVRDLTQQQADEVKKNDWCQDELHENDMSTAKAKDMKSDLESQVAERESRVTTLQEEIETAKTQIKQSQVNLQQATKDRKEENLEFQKTVADQTMTIEVLKKALNRLASFYDFLQTSTVGALSRQTPPVPQAEYKPSSAGGGVMEMIEKLIGDAQTLMQDAQKSEANAQRGYEQLLADTNGSVEALQKDAVSKSEAMSDAKQDMLRAESGLDDTEKELDGFDEFNKKLHKECDFLLNNFNLRQKSRQEELESLQQAKQILSGAAAN